MASHDEEIIPFDYRPGISINDHITAFNQLVANLLNLDETFKDEDWALMLFSSLPDEFEYFETALLYRKDKVSLDEVYAALYSYKLSKKDKNRKQEHLRRSNSSKRLFLQLKTRRRGKSHSKTRLGKDECTFCHEKRHWNKDYPKLK